MNNHEILTVIIDCNGSQWDCKEHFTYICDSLVFFLNSYCLLHRRNELCVIGNHATGCEIVYPKINTTDGSVPVLHTLSTKVKEGLTLLAEKNGVAEPRSSLSQAFSLALCVMNRRQQLKQSNFNARTLIIQKEPDVAKSYNAVMNCIFCAQKLNILVDCLVVGPQESSFLQQACFLTNGIYQSRKSINMNGLGSANSNSKGDDLLQLLMHYFLPSRTARQHFLHSPLQGEVNFRASCVCHQKAIEFAFMCSVCLSLHCEKTDACCTCGSHTGLQPEPVQLPSKPSIA